MRWTCAVVLVPLALLAFGASEARAGGRFGGAYRSPYRSYSQPSSRPYYPPVAVFPQIDATGLATGGQPAQVFPPSSATYSAPGIVYTSRGTYYAPPPPPFAPVPPSPPRPAPGQ